MNSLSAAKSDGEASAPFNLGHSCSRNNCSRGSKRGQEILQSSFSSTGGNQFSSNADDSKRVKLRKDDGVHQNDSKSDDQICDLLAKAVKPKRPMSAYNFFFRDERAKLLSEASSSVDIKEGDSGATESSKKRRRRRPHGVFTFQQLGKIMGKKWKSIDSATLAKYNKMAKDDSERYRREMEEYYAGQDALLHNFTDKGFAQAQVQNLKKDDVDDDVGSDKVCDANPEAIDQATQSELNKKEKECAQRFLSSASARSLLTGEDTVRSTLDMWTGRHLALGGHNYEHPSAYASLSQSHAPVGLSHAHGFGDGQSVVDPLNLKSLLGYRNIVRHQIATPENHIRSACSDALNAHVPNAPSSSGRHLQPFSNPFTLAGQSSLISHPVLMNQPSILNHPTATIADSLNLLRSRGALLQPDRDIGVDAFASSLSLGLQRYRETLNGSIDLDDPTSGFIRGP